MTATKKPRRQTISKRQYLTEASGLLNPALLSPSEAMAVVLGRLESARRAVKRASIRQWTLTKGVYTLPSRRLDNQSLADLPSPNAVLSRLNSSHVLPQFVLRTPPEARTVASAIALVDQLYRAGQPSSHLLDLLAATGVSWAVAATLFARVTGTAMSGAEVDAVANARRFWVLFSEGRVRYEALVNLGAAKPLQGDWAYLDSRELDGLLPALILPDHCQRKEYFGRYVYSAVPRLDLYSASYKPLCQHRFESLCSSLLVAGSLNSNSEK